jgi:hypothetical protein|tara:strand:- start:351 stop:584 length:234 start_codon:yes stop_codon:yes gene_type:complete
MNIDCNLTVGSNEVYIGLTPFEFSYDKSWGMTFNIMKLHFALTKEAMEKTFAVFSYTNTKYLHRLELLGICVFCRFK